MESEFVFTQNNSPGHLRSALINFFLFGDQSGNNSSLCFFAPAQTLTWPQHIYHKVDTSISVPLSVNLFYCNVITYIAFKVGHRPRIVCALYHAYTKKILISFYPYFILWYMYHEDLVMWQCIVYIVMKATLHTILTLSHSK